MVSLRSILTLSLLCAAPAALSAETIVLSDGSVIQGTVSCEDELCVIESASGSMAVARSAIRFIDGGSSSTWLQLTGSTAPAASGVSAGVAGGLPGPQPRAEEEPAFDIMAHPHTIFGHLTIPTIIAGTTLGLGVGYDYRLNENMRIGVDFAVGFFPDLSIKLTGRFSVDTDLFSPFYRPALSFNAGIISLQSAQGFGNAQVASFGFGLSASILRFVTERVVISLGETHVYFTAPGGRFTQFLDIEMSVDITKIGYRF